MKNSVWSGGGADCIGPLHIKQHLPMQDSFQIKFLKAGFVLAVSDGLGTKLHSDFGSKMACKCFIKCAWKWTRCGAKSSETLVRHFHALWVKSVEKAGFVTSDCAATFLGAVCVRQRIFLFRLGDGMIVCLKRKESGESEHILLSDKKSDSFSNVTVCLKSQLQMSEWEIVSANAEKTDCVFLCTDGISDDLQDGAAFSFVSDLAFQYAGLTKRQIAADMKKWILNWPVPRHSDDKTAVFIHRLAGKKYGKN